MANDKTNVARLLDAANISYRMINYDQTMTDGLSIAKTIGENPEQVFKTLVTIGSDKEHYVFCVPVNKTLHLKKAAKAVQVKSIEMIHQKELLPLTGYVHGGCSPIGMKKKFITIIDETAQLFELIYVSAGRLGFQIEISPETLKDYIQAKFIDIIE